mgnify:CR=1 FL=1
MILLFIAVIMVIFAVIKRQYKYRCQQIKKGMDKRNIDNSGASFKCIFSY